MSLFFHLSISKQPLVLPLMLSQHGSTHQLTLSISWILFSEHPLCCASASPHLFPLPFKSL